MEMSKSTEAEIIARSLALDAARRAYAASALRCIAEFCGHFVELVRIDDAEMDRLNSIDTVRAAAGVPVYYTLRDDWIHRVWPRPSNDIKVYRLQPIDA